MRTLKIKLKSVLAMVTAVFMATGTAAAQQQGEINATDATVAWSFNQGTDSPTTADNISVPEAVSSSFYSLGDNLYIYGSQAIAGENLTQLNPTVKSNAVDEDAYISFSFVPKKGVSFTAKSLSFNAAKFGTDGGIMDIYAVSGDKRVALVTNYQPLRNNVGMSSANYDISALGTVNERVDIIFYVYNLNDNKQIGLSQIKITGDFNGTPEDVPVYTLAVTAADAAAGTVSSNPAGTEFDEGTRITVTATENFGYHFAAWVDETGTTVSADNPYSFEISKNTTLTATYTKNNVYALNLELEGGANANLVQFAPEGNVVDGVHYYEEGTDVRLTALDNRILTFTNWEDSSTDPERDVKMDGEKNLTATFSAEDYIVGWDLYNDNPTSERAADYKDETENAGLLSLRNEAGNTSTWLANGVAKGQMNGKYAARVWRPLADRYYFEISFSTKGYENIRLSAAVGDDFNAHETVYAQVSLDGTNYTTFGTYHLPYRAWDSEEFELPDSVAGQDLIRIRFMPDWSSQLVGSESENDGLAVAEIFVLADKDIVNDNEAPGIVSTLPKNGAEGVTANGSVILTFDEKVAAGSNGGKATLDGREIEPAVSGKTVVYRYTGLKYATKYTFSLPSGAIEDRSGNAFEGIELEFTTMERQQPEARVYDAVVDQDGTGDYLTVQAAIDAAPENRIRPWLIFIKEGTYKEHVNIPENKPYLHFTGQSRDKVKITDDKLSGGDNALPVDDGATFVARSSDLYFEGISFENSYGVEKNDGPQALALNTKNDRVVFNNCGMYSYQDTWITPSESSCRGYVKNCFIEGAVDFIYNNGDYFFDGCTLNIVRKDGGYIVAPSHDAGSKWGYVFMNNTITAPGVPSETSVWLGRPWHNRPKTVFINTRAEVTIPAAGWFDHMGGIPAVFADYNTMDADGNPVDLTHRRSEYWYVGDSGDTIRGTAKNRLTDEEAAQYTIENVLRGTDSWQPELLTEPCAAPVPVISEEKKEITWEAVPYAICYVITKDGKVEGFTTNTWCTYDEGSVYSLQAVNEYGGLSRAAVATSEPTGIGSVEADGELTVKGIYTADGMRLSSVQKGLNIVVYTSENGHTVVRKVIK